MRRFGGTPVPDWAQGPVTMGALGWADHSLHEPA